MGRGALCAADEESQLVLLRLAFPLVVDERGKGGRTY